MASISVLSLATLGNAMLWWETPLVTIAVLAFLSLLMLLVECSKRALMIYAIAFILGPLAEAAMIHQGAWAYSQPQLLGFPYWLPFLWGNASLMFNRINCYIHHRSAC